MADSTRTPPLTPQFCLTTTALSMFLSRSRATTDDTISQNLSALSNPSRTPFKLHPTNRLPSTSRLPNSSCGSFIAEKLLPEYEERDRILTYCDKVAKSGFVDSALSEDAQDEAEAYARYEGMVKRGEEKYASSKRRRTDVEMADEFGQANEPDERLDPYSARQWKPESRTELLERVIRREREIEEIVRQRSWSVVKDRCVGVEGNWHQVLKSWSGKPTAQSEENR